MEQQVDQKQLGDMLKKSAKLQHVLALIFFLKFSHSISTPEIGDRMLFSRIHPERSGISQRGVGIRKRVRASQTKHIRGVVDDTYQAGKRVRFIPSPLRLDRRTCIKQANDVTCAGSSGSDRFEQSSARAPIRKVTMSDALSSLTYPLCCCHLLLPI